MKDETLPEAAEAVLQVITATFSISVTGTVRFSFRAAWETNTPWDFPREAKVDGQFVRNDKRWWVVLEPEFLSTDVRVAGTQHALNEALRELQRRHSS
ncbi:hypothetical protein L0Y40_00340 [Candidatus Wolfebacteria bacterium]|nr:hypothetical protein [Candidatus Wolfebacteria bacterium]